MDTTHTPNLNRRAVYILGIIALAVTLAIIIGTIVTKRNEAAERERGVNELLCAVYLEEGDLVRYELEGCGQ